MLRAGHILGCLFALLYCCIMILLLSPGTILQSITHPSIQSVSGGTQQCLVCCKQVVSVVNSFVFIMTDGSWVLAAGGWSPDLTTVILIDPGWQH